MSQSPKSATSAAQSETDLVAAILLRFDRNWGAGQLEAFAAEISNWPAELRRRTLALLVKIDLERRWQAGQPLNVEQYLSRFSDLGTLETVAPELLLAEWEARRQRGETPRFGDFSRRFPQQAPALQQLLRQAESGESVARGEAPPSVSHRETPRPSRVSTASISPAKLSLNSASAPSVGTTSRRELSGRFGKYEIRRRLGKGGMGEVYLAYDPKADREVAVKIPQFADEESADVIQRFYREVRVAATIQHPNICPIWEVDEVNGVPYLAMPFIQGETLDARMKKRTKPLDERTIAQLIRKLALALAEAHRLGIIHRDLKPANIMFDHRKEPIVMDFGLARRAGQAESKLTKSGMIVGTPAYMPIEQVQAQDELIGPVSDVYSLGVILYELLTGRLPFDGPALSVLALILTAQPNAPRNLRSDVDPRLEAICLKAIAKQPADRYQTMTEFAAALSEYLKSANAPRQAGDASPSVQSSTVANATSGSTLDNRSEAPFGFPIFGEDETPATSVSPTALKKKPAHSLKATVLISAQQVRSRWSRLPFAAQVVALCAGFGFLLGVILWFRSGDALVKVEVHSEGVEVTFNNETLKLTDGPHEYKVSPGDHTLHIKSGNAEFDTEKFTLKKGDNPAVTVELVKGEIVAMHGKKTIRRQSLGTQKAKVSDKSNATASRSPSNGSSALSSQPTNAPAPAIAPFDTAQARKHQEAWAGYLKVPIEFENSLGMKLRLIPPGEFLMGAGPDDSQAMPDEVPQHTVQISRPFHLGVYEVTQEEYEKVTGTNPSFFGKRENLGGDVDTMRWPVEQVTWDDAVKFCERLSAMPKESEAGRSYRLPTEAEWEYASRAGTTTIFTYGTSLGSAQANFNGAYQIPRTTTGPWLRRPEIVGKYPANALGLFDMLGNVWEWCGDSKRTYEAGTHLDPRGPVNGPRVNRGGGWISSAGECRSSHRRPDNLRPEDRHRSTGLRVVCVVSVADSKTSMKSETSQKTDYDAIATGRWVRIVDASTPLSNPERMKFNDGVLELNDVALNLPNVIARDLIVRGKVKKVSGQVAGIRLRDNGHERLYGFWFNGGNWFGIGKSGQRPWTDLKEGRVGPPQPDFFEMAASVVGDSLSLYVNGTRVYSVRDSELIDGSVTVVTGGGKSLFKDVEVMVLDAVSAASATPGSPATTPTAQVRPADAPAPAIAPFDAVQAKKHQQEWAAYLKVPVEYENSRGMKFVLIPPGEFTMGAPAADLPLHKNAEPAHSAVLKSAFYLCPYEITVAEFRAFAEAENLKTEAEQGAGAWGFSPNAQKFDRVKSLNWRSPGYSQADDHPVTCVSWSEAVRYCDWLSKSEGLAHRLPSETEWEYAFRAGTQFRYWSGDRDDSTRAKGNVADVSLSRYWAGYPRVLPYGPCESWDDGYPVTSPVGKFPANAFSLHDMLGNVREFCGGEVPVFRGGSFSNPAMIQRGFERVPDRGMPDFAIGFRVAISANDVQDALKRKVGLAPQPNATTEPIDLLKRIDLSRDTISGAWSKSGDKLASPSGKNACVVLPADVVPEEYELTVTAERVGSATKPVLYSNLTLFLVFGGKEAAVVLDSEQKSGPCSGLNLLDGLNVGENVTTWRKPVLQLRRPTTIVCTVRKDRIVVENSGETIIDWRGKPDSLSHDPYWTAPLPKGRLGIGSWDGRFEIARITLRPLAAAAGDDSLKKAEKGPGSSSDGTSAVALPPVDAPKPAIAPFSATQAMKYQEEWAAYLKLPIEYTNSIGMKFRLIPPGEFTMGSTPEEIEATLAAAGSDEDWKQYIRSEAPQHKVVLTKPIYLGIHEVTQAEYEGLMKANPSYFTATAAGKVDVVNLDTRNHPVERASWYDSAEFCIKLSEKEELKPCYVRSGDLVTVLDGTGYRLPTEAEWEFACRAGTTSKFWIGDRDEDLAQVGWFNVNSGSRTHAVGELKANPLGLFDMHANVWEWVQDWWSPTSYDQFQESPAVDPKGPSSAGSKRVVRGGSWYVHHRASHCRASARFAFDPTDRIQAHVGIRLAVSVDAVREALEKKAKANSGNRVVSVPKQAIAPFSATQAKKHQAEWATHLKVPIEDENSIGMKTVLIPPGEFTMGRMPGEAARFPRNGLYQEPATTQHKVTLTRPFRMGTTEVTRRQWREVMGSEPWQGKDKGADGDDYPANFTSKPAAKDFCRRLSEKEGKTYRLPTEAEWEFACRAGSETLYFFGEDRAQVGEYACLGRLQAVATKKPNRWGLFDMYGNLWEWVADGRTAFTADAAVDPLLNPGDAQSIIRGSCFRSAIPAEFSSGARHSWPGTLPTDEKGFRIVCEVDQGTVAPVGAGESSNTGGGAKNTTKKNLSTSKSTTKSADAFQSRSEWVSDNGYQRLTVLDRKGGTFRARLRNEATVDADKVDREVSGTIKDNKVTWLAKDVRPSKGGPGGDNFGTLDKDVIDFRWSDKSGGSGTFTLRLEPGGK